MEKDDYMEDEALRKLIRLSPLESPSEKFIERVMSNLQDVAVVEKSKISLYLYFKSILPYIGVGALVLLFIFSSDLPFDQFIPGNDLLTKYFLPYFNSLSGSIKSLFASKYVTFALGIALSAGFLVLVEYLISHYKSMRFSSM